MAREKIPRFADSVRNDVSQFLKEQELPRHDREMQGREWRR